MVISYILCNFSSISYLYIYLLTYLYICLWLQNIICEYAGNYLTRFFCLILIFPLFYMVINNIIINIYVDKMFPLWIISLGLILWRSKNFRFLEGLRTLVNVADCLRESCISFSLPQKCLITPFYAWNFYNKKYLLSWWLNAFFPLVFNLPFNLAHDICD